MKINFLLTRYCSIAMALLLLVFTSCEDDEDGQDDTLIPFTAGFDVTTMFLEASFINASTNARSYAWDFGVEGTDEDTSVDYQPSYTYAEAGTYTVSLTVRGDGGLTTDTFTMDVTVAEEMIMPMAGFTSAADFLMVTFTDTSENAVSYAWDFGDGAGTSTEASPTYTYAEAGTYTVSLMVTSETDNTDVFTADVTVDAVPIPPTADFTFAATDLEVVFTDASVANDGNITGYAWDFGDGTGTSTDASPTYTYGEAGNFTVALTITFDEILGETTATTTQNVSVTAGAGATATFAAVIQNADFQSFPTAENNNNDLVDAWTIDPDNTFNDGTDTPFNFWRNDDLEAWVSTPANNGGSGTTDKASSSGTDATSAGGTSDRSLKFDSSGERAYQPFEVEAGVTYSLSAFVRTESTPVGELEGTFYILSSEPADETDLASVALVSVPVNSNMVDGWQQVSFGFTADATFTFSQDRVDENMNDILTSTTQQFVIFYFVPTNTVAGDNEVFLTDVVITTPGF